MGCTWSLLLLLILQAQFPIRFINYDLPWNPQRIEQRIGRCHRYGQKHDVVVVNFLNRKNEADKRVYELLSEKFKLFEGVFGTSDEVLGAIESGVDFEKRIAAIYQRCRMPEEISAAFDQLQKELSYEIKAAMSDTRRKLLENFDDEVREKLKIRAKDSQAILSRFEKRLMQLTRYELRDQAKFLSDTAFDLYKLPQDTSQATIPLGRYELPANPAMPLPIGLGIHWLKSSLSKHRSECYQPLPLSLTMALTMQGVDFRAVAGAARGMIAVAAAGGSVRPG